MGLFFRPERETEVRGDGDGWISIKQQTCKGEVVVWLTIHQFQTIFNHEKHLLAEAMGDE